MIGTNIALTQAANVPVVPADTLAPVVVLPTMTSAPVLPTNTVAPAVSGVINYTANCRSGPGANFPMLVILNPGTQVSITGTNKATDGSLWWVVQSAGNPDCWVVDGAVSITGNKGSVVVVVSPPTPTPIPPPSWTNDWFIWQWQGVTLGGEYESHTTLTMVQTGNYATWSYTIESIYYHGSGTVSPDGMLIIGTETDMYNRSYGVRFERNPSNLNQFRGRWWWAGNESSDGAYCGSINGAPKPSPCKPN